MRIYEAIQKTVAIYPGRFHPFHKGHASVYAFLKSKFDTVFIATSNKIDPPKSPFSFEEKRAMMIHAGLPASAIVQTKNPYQAQEILANFNPETTAVVFAVSQKDMDEDPRFAFKPKKDGSPGYFQPAADANMVGFGQHGYIMVAPTLDFKVLGKPMRSASEFRKDFASADDETQKNMISDLYGSYDQEIHNIMRNKIKEHNDQYAHYIEAAESVIHDLTVLYEHKQYDTTGIVENVNKIVNKISSIPVVETLDYLDPNDIMDSVVIVPGVGTMSIKGLMANLREKFADLADAAGRETPDTFRNIQRKMNSNIIGIMLDSLVNAFDDIEKIRRKGGKNSRGIPKNVFDSVIHMHEAWSAKYKRSIDCNNPKGFSQKAHCAGRNKKESVEEATSKQDISLKHLHPNLRSTVRTALMKYPMADNELAAVVQMLQQELNRSKQVNKDLNRLDKENDAQDIELDYTDSRLDNLEKTAEAVITEYVFQSIPLRVLDNLASRKDNKPFPIKTGPDSTFDVTPDIARKFMTVYYQKDPAVQKAIDKTLNDPRKFIDLFTDIMQGKRASGAKVSDIAPDKLTADVNEAGVGIITKQNTTPDVKPGETERQSKKLGLGGKPKPLHKSAAKNSNPNKLMNLGITEGYKLQLERDTDMMVLNITDTTTGKRTEVRGKPGYETNGYDKNDKLHQLLDKISKTTNISELINGEPVGINPKHPDGASAKTATDTAFNEAFDNPYKFKVTNKSSSSWEAQALTDNNVIISFLASNVETGWGIDFKTADADDPTNTTYDLTGKGDGQRTMTTVLAMLKQFIGQYSPKKIYFDAAKDAGNSRTSLYQKLLQRFAGGLGYKVDIEDAGSRDDFTLVKVQETKVNEIQSMTGYPKGKVTYWNHDEEKLKKVGKLGDYNIHKSIESEADGGDHVFVIKKDEAPLGELILTQRDSPFAQAKNQGFWTSSVHFDPEIQGKGLAVPLYAYAVKKGYDIVSDNNQSKGSEILWQKLSKQSGINVYAWDRENNKFFAYDPEEDPRAQVYSDDDLKQKLIDEYRKLMQKAESEKEREELQKELTKELEDITPDGYDIRLVAVANKLPVTEAVSQVDIDQLERFADKMFAKVGIDVEFGRHFMDRVNDERNGKPITPSELTRLFKQEYKRYGKPIAQMGPEQQAVMKDLQTDINIPFMLQWDADNNELDLIAKTVMRKKDFKTSNREFAVERGGINVPFASGMIAQIVPHRALKVKKSTPGRLRYDQPEIKRKRNK